MSNKESLPKQKHSIIRAMTVVASAALAGGLAVQNRIDHSSDTARPLKTYYDTPVSSPVPSQRAGTTARTSPVRSANKNIYIVGDSYVALAMQHGLAQTVQHAGGKLTANGVVSRSIEGGGVRNQSGMAALEADRTAVHKAGVIVVELGTNGGDTSENVTAMMSKIRSENHTAPVYWVNVGALGYAPRANQEAAMKNFNEENAMLYHSAGQLGFRILNWCGVAFGGTAENCLNKYGKLKPGVLGPDYVHPSVDIGLTKFEALLASSVPK